MALNLQAKRAGCGLEPDAADFYLTLRPELDGILQCMKGLAIDLRLGNSSMPLGEYCNAISTVRQCMENLEEWEKQVDGNGTLSFRAAGHSKATYKMIESSVCNFMPETACGLGSKADVVFVLDGSGSIGIDNMKLLLQFVKDVLSSWDIGQDKIRIGVVVFSKEAVVEFHLKTYDDKDDLMKAIDAIRYPGEATNTAAALDLVKNKMFLEANGNRQGVPDLAIVITDGKSNDHNATLAAAKAVKQIGIQILSVGIGKELDMDELEAMSSSPHAENIFNAANFSALAAIQSNFLQRTCAAISNFMLPFNLTEEVQCQQGKDLTMTVELSLLKAARVPYYTLDMRQHFCRNLPQNHSELSECDDGEREYGERLFGSLQGFLQHLCHQSKPEDHCDLHTATTCLQELANSFVLPAMSPCSLYSETEVCVLSNTVGCHEAVAWPLRVTLELWRELAQSTCCQGPCDPAQAVLCFMDVQHMSKSPTPDWEGICSSLATSMECAERNVLGCDRCQQDTVRTIGGKVYSELAKTCIKPPEFKCRALAAMECKETLVKFTEESHGQADGLFCLKVFEARKCIAGLTADCDSATKLSISIELEEIITAHGGETCSKENILPVCRQTLVQRVETILSFNPFNESDPAYKYKASSQNVEHQDDGSKATNQSSNSAHQGWKEDFMSIETIEAIEFPNTYLGQMCREAQMAYLCVAGSLKDFPPPNKNGLMDMLTATWRLAWLQCEGILEPLTCYTCNNTTDNELCNKNPPMECDNGYRMCQTEVMTDANSVVLNIWKGCVVPYECKPGCENHKCTYCCDGGQDCNKPEDGPLTGACDLLQVSVCLSEMTSAILESDTINCSFVQQQSACIEYARAECEENGRTKVAEALSGFLASDTIVKCQVELTDSHCGVVTVSAFASLIASGLNQDSFDFCPLLTSVQNGIEAAKSDKKCEQEDVTVVTASFDLLHSQLWFLDCPSTTIPPHAVCDPLAAIQECMPTSQSDCNLEQKEACMSGYLDGCQPVQEIHPYLMLHFSANLMCSNSSVSVPTLPNDLQPLSQCLQAFSASFNAVLLDHFQLRAPVMQLVTCLLSTWEVEFLLSQPPVYKVYISQVIYFLEHVLLPAVTYGSEQVAVNVSTQCQAGLVNAKASFSSQVMLMLLRPFGSFSKTYDFCIFSKELEVNISSQLSVCSAEEKKYQQQLWVHLHDHRLGLCPNEDPEPQCSVHMAAQCLARFSAVMDIMTTQDGLDVCGSLNSSLSCVRAYTSTCSAGESQVVSQAVYDVVSVWQSTCPQVVSESVCDVEEVKDVSPTCPADPSSDLDDCDSMSVYISCSSVKEVLDCYKKAVGMCPESNQTYQIRFKNAFAVHYDFASAFCGLDLSTWNLTARDQCLAPVCNLTAAAYCLVLNDLTAVNTATVQAPIRVANAVRCFQETLTGCDVALRAYMIYKASIQLTAFINIFPALANLSLSLQVEFSDPFGFLVPGLVDFAMQLDHAIYNPQWDLLPLCWWLHDFNLFLIDNIRSNFRKDLLKRASYGIQMTLDGVCNDPSVIGVILNVAPIENEVDACPAKDIMEKASAAFYAAVVTGIIHGKSRKHFCMVLEEAGTVDLTACSPGRRQQFELLVTFLQQAAGQVCSATTYCNVTQIQQCVLEVVTVLGGLGLETSTDQVCLSVKSLDACISQYSYRCDDFSLKRISTSSQHVRQLAVEVCGKMEPAVPPSTCTVSEEDACDMDKVRKCSFNEVFDLLSTFSSKDAHCRILQHTQDCYNHINKSCSNKNTMFDSTFGLPMAGLAVLREKWECDDGELGVTGPANCTEHCNTTAASACITTMSRSLRLLGPFGDACILVAQARQCLQEKVRDCKDDERESWLKQLTSALTLYQSMTAHCVDVYTCLNSFFTISRQILSTDDNTDIASNNGKGKSNKGGDSSLLFLCQRAQQHWKCSEGGLGHLPKSQRDLLKHIFAPLWAIISKQCADTVALECYKCSSVPLFNSLSGNVCGDETEQCDRNERCSSQYMSMDNQVYVTRGCLHFAHCHAKDKNNVDIKCCDQDLCNTNTDINGETDTETSCYLEYAVDCALTFAETLLTQGSVDCMQSMEKLQCVSEKSAHCPGAQDLHSAANLLMLSLAQTSCVQGDLSPGCSSIAVSSMTAILSNAFSNTFACSGLNASIASLDYEEASGECTALDMVALREVLSYTSIITFDTCNSEDCQSPQNPSTQPDQPQEEQKEAEDCNYLDTSLCGRQALKVLNTWTLQNTSQICSAAKESAVCAVTELEGCDIPPCLKGLINQVKKKAEDNCHMNFTAPDKDNSNDEDQEQCRPSIVCDIEAAFQCTDVLVAYLNDSTINDSSLCMMLEKAVECHASKTASCRSILSVLSVSYFKNAAGQAIMACPDNMTVDLTPPADVYSNGANCLMNFYTQIEDIMSSSNFVGPMCSAVTTFKSCQKNLPKLTEEFLMNDTMALLESISAQGICDSEPHNQTDDDRDKREANCSLEDRARASLQVTLSTMFNSLPLSSRPGQCNRLIHALEVLAQHIGKDCQYLGLSLQEKKILDSLFEFGSEQQEKFCIRLNYEPAGCKPDLFPLCMESFSMMTSYSLTETDTLCRAAESSLKYLQKFSTGCTAGVDATVYAIWQQVRATVGNSCPNLTLGLFCPSTYENLVNPLPCNPGKAKGCLPKAEHLSSVVDRLNPTYCSDLKGGLTCAKNSVQGCLLSEVQDVQASVKGLGSKLTSEISFCYAQDSSMNINLANYSSACVASKPCSLKAALDCFRLEGPQNATVCQVIGQKRSCLNTALSSCSQQMEVVAIAHGLFSLQFKSMDVNCTAPFVGLISAFTHNVNDVCTKNFVDQFMFAVVMQRTRADVCSTFQNYNSCITARSSGNLVSVLKPSLSFLDEMMDLFCQPESDHINASGAEVTSVCGLEAASFCLVKELIWVFNRYLLPNADNRYFCQQWYGQETRACVISKSEKCKTLVQDLLLGVAEMSNKLVMSSGVCETLNVCYVDEAYYSINEFSVAISSYTVNKNTTKLCLKKRETESDVSIFTAKCSSAQKLRTEASLTRITQLVEEICENVELPAPPICPELPVEQQHCNIGAAFTCVIQFNKELLLQGMPLFYRNWCTSLENMMQCAAFNTSSCDRKNEDLQGVIAELDDFKKVAGLHCHWLSTDMCTHSARCPAQDSNCDIKLQIDLLKNPLSDVCLYINQSNNCLKQNTISCTPAQKLVAQTTIKNRLEQLSVPNLKCDGSEMAPCLLRAKAASWQVLTHVSGNNSLACSTMQEAEQCLSQRVNRLIGGPTRQDQTAQNMSAALKSIIDRWCITPGTENCGIVLAQVMNTIYNLTVSLTTSQTLDKAVICSVRQAVLADLAGVRQLHGGSCNFTALGAVELQLSAGVFSQCISDPHASCLTALAAAQTCSVNYNTSADSCRELNLFLRCMAPALGLCEQSNAELTSLMGQVNQRVTQSGSCHRPPLIGLSTPTTSALYLSEQGGYVDITFNIFESYELYAVNNASREVYIRVQVANKDPPKCLEDGSEEISQVSVLYEGGQPCGFRLARGENWGSPHTIRLLANLDGREDNMQQASVLLYADIFNYNETSRTWIKSQESFQIATYQVNIEDTDVNAVCSSVGSHTETFDDTVFNNFEVGDFVMYRNTFTDAKVTVSYQKCTLAATCTCSVKVSTANTTVVFDRCQHIDASGPPKDIQVTWTGQKQQTQGMAVYRHRDLQTYYVVMDTGTIVTVKANFLYIDVWITSSPFDFGKTGGMCGLFDGNAYNDLILPGGESYTVADGEMQYGILSPRGFINAWRTSQVNSSRGASAVSTCSCLDSSTSDGQCSALSRVATCDFVQGEDITQLLIDAAEQPSGLEARRRRRAADSSSIDLQKLGWPTASNWTEEKATEHCELLLERTESLKYCAQAVQLVNGSLSFTRLVSTCVNNIRLSDSTAIDNFTVIQGVENCRSLFLSDPIYKSSEAVQQVVLKFFSLTCDNNCNDNGDCKMGVCYCYPGFVGGNCSYQRTDLPLPYNTRIIKNGLCEVSNTSRCDDIFISGRGFVDSHYMACHVQSVKVVSSGFNSPVGLVTKVMARLVTANMAHCKITRSQGAQETLMVAISNDGIHPSTSMLYSAYDPQCYTCDPTTHQCTHIAMNTCEIEGQCYMPDSAAAGDSCLFCDPLKAPTKWSVRDVPECANRPHGGDNNTEPTTTTTATTTTTTTEVSPLLIAVLAVGSALLVVGIIGITICCVTRRKPRQSNRDQEFARAPPSYENYGFGTSGVDPMQIFSQGSITKRAVTSESGHVPSSLQSGQQ